MALRPRDAEVAECVEGYRPHPRGEARSRRSGEDAGICADWLGSWGPDGERDRLRYPEQRSDHRRCREVQRLRDRIEARSGTNRGCSKAFHEEARYSEERLDPWRRCSEY
ncbi:hypothetical protein D3C72_2160750 [compost metagenome]